MDLHKKLRNLAIMNALVLVMAGKSFALDIKSFNLTESDGHPYDAADYPASKTEAQNAVDYLATLGVNHIVLTPTAKMPSADASQIVPDTRPVARVKERLRYLRLIDYIHSKKMTVGMRPIVLVERAGVDDKNWHGNMHPKDPAAWFKSLESYLGIYTDIAASGKVEEFTIAAELYSMTVGIEDQWKTQPYGFPREWTDLIRRFKKRLGPCTRIMYDINYTDEAANNDGTGPSGGEMERWRYRLVDLKPRPGQAPSPTTLAWEHLKELWLELDAVGIDMYRSLMARNDVIPSQYKDLESKLQARAEEYATDLDSKLLQIQQAVGVAKPVIIKETGFKSCTACFIDPFIYDDMRKVVNIPHQAAAYEAFMGAFVAPQWPWLAGIAFWDMAVDPTRAGPNDPGFTPRGKPQTEEVIRKGWGN